MEEQKLSFDGSSFLIKEAANPRVLNTLSNVLKVFRRIPQEETPTMGKFILKPTDSTVSPEALRLFDEAEVIDKLKTENNRQGTGSFVTDALLGLTKKIAPISRESIENTVYKGKQAIENADTTAGSFLAGKDPNSFRGKLFSTKVNRQIGEAANENGSLSRINREDRRPSLMAPVENTVKITAPILAASYVGEKLYPNKPQDSNEAPYEQSLEKKSSELNENCGFDPFVVDQMDKIASLQKIALLEENLTEAENKLESMAMEKNAAEKRLEITLREKESIEKRASFAEENLMEKTAEFEELRLRTIAQLRSKVAVDLSEQMLECGIIKQAQFESTIDKLMECDESAINMYQNMVKEAKIQDESLESLAFLREYKSNDKLAPTSSKEAAASGLSKRGQSIGEAARDLNKK